MVTPAISSTAVPAAKFPPGTMLGALADEMDKTRKSLERFKKITVTQPLQDLNVNLDQLTKEELNALTEVAQAKENQHLWSYAHLISATLYASSSISYGAYLIANGEPRGKNLIIAGSCLLGNTLMEFTGGWKLASRLLSCGFETFENVLNIAFPLATTYASSLFTAHTLAQLSNDQKRFMKNLDWLASWINMFVQCGNIYTSWVKGQAERQLTYLQGKMTTTRMRIDPITLLNESQTANAKNINDRIKSGIKKIFNGTSALPAGAV
jgi:hypothetical protein